MINSKQAQKIANMILEFDLLLYDIEKWEDRKPIVETRNKLLENFKDFGFSIQFEVRGLQQKSYYKAVRNQ